MGIERKLFGPSSVDAAARRRRPEKACQRGAYGRVQCGAPGAVGICARSGQAGEHDPRRVRASGIVAGRQPSANSRSCGGLTFTAADGTAALTA
jgi:hypothetical protein